MSRARHIAVKVAEGLLIVFVLLHLSLYVVFQVPAVQTWTARKVADVVEGKINGDISIGKMSIVFFNRVSLYDVTVRGFGAPPPWGESDTCRFYNPGDTLAHLSKMSASFSLSELLMGKLGGHRVVLEDGFFYLLKEDSLGSSNLNRIFNIPFKPKEKEKEVFPDISVGDVRIKNCRFSIANPFDTKELDTSAVQMQYNNLRLRGMTGHFSDFRTVDGEIRCHIDELSATEASGTGLKNLTGDFHLGPRGSGMDDMHLEDAEGTVIEADRLYFIYSSPEEIAEWVDSVVMDVKFRKSTFTFNSLKHFVPSMADNNLTITIGDGGEVKGPVAAMEAKGLSVALPGGETMVTVNAAMNGIPDMPNTTITGTAEVKISTLDIPPLISDWTGRQSGGGIASIAKGNIISEKVEIDGPFRKMTLKGEMRCGEGTLSHWLTMSLFTPQFSIGGDVEVKSMDLGAVLGNEMFGIADFSLKGKVTSGKRGGINLDYLNVDKFGFIDYDYRNMTATAEISDTLCRLFFVSRDDEFKIDVNLDAFFDGEGRSGRYYCALNAPKADLKALNLMEKDSVARLNDIHLRIDAGYDGLNNAVGKLELRDLSYTNTRGTVVMDSLQIISSERDSVFDVSVRSPFFSVDYRGENPLLVAVMRVKEILFDSQFGKLSGKEKKDGDKKRENVFLKRNDYLTLETFDTWSLTNVLADGVYLSENSTLKMTVSDRDSVDILFRTDRIAQKKNYLRDVSLRVNNPDSVIRISVISPELKFGNTYLTDNEIGIRADHGVIGLEYLFRDEDRTPGRDMNLSSDISFSRDNEGFVRTSVNLNGMNVYLNGKKWQMDSSLIVLGHKFLQLDRFRFYGEKSELRGNGIISQNPKDEMRVTLDSLDLAVTNDFASSDMKLSGTLSGSVSIRDFFNKSYSFVDITGSDISLYDNSLGTVKLTSKWDPADERLNLMVRSSYQDRSPINLSGYYKHTGNELFVNASLDELSLAYASPFLKDILVIDGGTLSGNLFLSGKNGEYSLDSEDARFVNFAFTPVYTNVPYLMNGGMKFKRDEIKLDGITIGDRNGKTASLNGSITHNLFTKINLDLNLSFDGIEALDIPENSDEALYGTATATGIVSVTGPVDDILISADIRTGHGTSVYVPVSNAYAAKSTDILLFKDYSKGFEDPYDSILVYHEERERAEKEKEKGKFRLEADATLYEDALVTIELDKALGNLVECHGNARVHLSVDPSRSVTDLRGRYTVSGGKAKYVFAGIIAREFSLKEGGVLDFRGPLSNMNLDIGATYRTRTSIAPLISDTSSVGSRQTVYASVGLNGALDNPGFTFDIEIPDLDPLTRSRVETAFATDEKVQQQFMALMLTGSFVRDEQSGVSNNNSNILFSNVSEMFSNQLNNVLRSLDVPIDVGLNYQKTANQKDIFDVNVSYQAFNNRLVLNGSVGNGNRYQNWGGNFEAELKMDRRGKFRFSLFTRAADQYSNYLDNSQRNGFGFSFQDEFTKFKEIFYSRRKRESIELEQVKEARAKLLEEYGDMEEKNVLEEQNAEADKDTEEEKE